MSYRILPLDQQRVELFTGRWEQYGTIPGFAEPRPINCAILGKARSPAVMDIEAELAYPLLRAHVKGKLERIGQTNRFRACLDKKPLGLNFSCDYELVAAIADEKDEVVLLLVKRLLNPALLALARGPTVPQEVANMLPLLVTDAGFVWSRFK